MAVTRNNRMNPAIEYDKWLSNLPKDMQAKYSKQIAEDKADYQVHKEQYIATMPPAPDPTETIDPERYRKVQLNPNTKEFQELYAGPEHPYSYEEWEAELRRSLLHKYLLFS